jgi:hypothetical protein
MRDYREPTPAGHEHRSIFRSRWAWVLFGFLAIAGYFLVTEHRAHVALALPYLPWLLLLACPLMHFFMHGRHGNHNDES